MTPSTFTFRTDRKFFGSATVQIHAFTSEEAEQLLKQNTGLTGELIKVERA